MNGEDAGFLHMDLPNQPMTTMSLAVLQPATGPDGEPDLLTLDWLRGHVAERLGELPSFRWRVLRVPGGLHHPVYVEDPEFDLDFHLREHWLPEPGGEAELHALFNRLAERRLDRRHPLWQLHLVHDLAGGRQALITRTHHCLMDGVAAFTTFSRIYSGVDHEVAAPADAWQPEELPRPSRLVVDALRDQWPNLKRLPELVARSVRNFQAVNQRTEQSDIAVPGPLKDTEPCSLNDAFTVRRHWTNVGLSLADMKAVKNAAGVSLNDVVLAVAAGGLRRYLQQRDDLPAKPLTCSVPVAFEPPDAPVRQWGNWFSSLTTSLATDVDDPWERLQTISTVMKESKLRFDLLGETLMPEWLDVVPPFIAERGVVAHNRGRQEDRSQADVNTLVSNIKGPGEKWHLGTALVDDLFLSGPPSNGVGSNFMVWSYGDRLMFGIRSFADSLESPADLAAGLHAALDELSVLAATHEAVTAPT